MSRLRRFAQLVDAASAVFLVSASFVSPAAAQPQETKEAYVDESGVVHYPFDPDALPGFTVSEEMGKVTKSGCAFASEAEGDAGQASGTVTVGDEVTFDPATCTREVAAATYPLSEVPDVVAERIRVDEQATESAGAPGDGIGVQATWTAKLNARIQDPLGIHVSSTTIERTWRSDGSWNNTGQVGEL